MKGKGLGQMRKVKKAQVAFVGLLLLIAAPLSAFGRDRESIATLRNLGEAFATVAEEASPAVVGIKAEWTVEQPVSTMQQSPFGQPFSPFGEDFFDFFFRRRAPRQQPEQREYQRKAQGSGFIISDDGYILTNNHLVGEAEKVQVELLDERVFTAEIVGTDLETDVAVIRIDSDSLPQLKSADSDEIEVGEWVLAIGNPLGLSHTVTAGIVSAKGRAGVNITTYENFIQTDAAINFGNSGGPLINLDGEAVGINTAIVGPGGNIGIGFAIPINMARDIADELIETGSVERGYLGVLPQDMTRTMAKAFGLEEPKGVLIPQVIEGSAADEAGLQHNDIILTFDGKSIESAAQLRNLVAKHKPGTRVKIVVLRDGERKTLTAKLEKRPPMEELAGKKEPSKEEDTTQTLGLAVQDLTLELAQRFGYKDQTGVIVTRVLPGSEAAEKGLRPGYLIKEIDRQKVKSARRFKQLASKALAENGQILLLVHNGQASQYVVLELPED